MAGGKFFALIDEAKASEARLDKLAEPLLEKMARSEKLAEQAVEAKSAKLDAVIDYIKRMDDTVEQLGDGENGGPKLDDTPAEDQQKTTAMPPPIPLYATKRT